MEFIKEEESLNLEAYYQKVSKFLVQFLLISSDLLITFLAAKSGTLWSKPTKRLRKYSITWRWNFWRRAGLYTVSKLLIVGIKLYSRWTKKQVWATNDNYEYS